MNAAGKAHWAGAVKQAEKDAGGEIGASRAGMAAIGVVKITVRTSARDRCQAIYVKYQVKDQDLFDKAFGYIRQYY